MSVTTRHEPHRARAGSGRQTPTKAGTARTQQRVARGPPPRRLARPGRYAPDRPVQLDAAPVATADGTPPARAPAAGEGRTTARLEAAAAAGRRHLPAPDPPGPPGARRGMLLLVARLVDVQVLHAGAYQAAARGESSISVSLPALRGGIYARDGSPLALSVPTDDVVADDFQVAHPGADGARAVADPPRPGHDPGRRSCTGRSGYVVLARQLPQSTGQTITADAFPGITLIADSKRVVPNGNLAAPGRRVHQRVPDTARPDSSTGTTSCWREPTARRRSWSRLRVWRCRSRR